MPERRPNRVRLRDVADQAGVSTRTVSNVVNGFKHVAPQTRERVQQAIDELGYRMDPIARGLRNGRTGFIALVVPGFFEPYFGNLADAVTRAARARGLQVLIETSAGDEKVERDIMRGALAHVADGVLLSASAAHIDGAPDGPLVMLGEHVATAKAPLVSMDNEAAGALLADHLVALGRRRIALLGPSGTEVSVLRERGVRAALGRHGIEPVLSLPTGARLWDARLGHELVSAALRGPGELPDAFVCFNDTLALGALHALHEAGIEVPGRVSVAGFDNIPQGEFAVPALTTVAPELDEIARRAVALLVQQIDLPSGRVDAGVGTVLVPGRLIRRQSCGPSEHAD